MPLNARILPHLRRRLLAWFDRHRRPMPWRENPTPYRVWLSEMMLQQTQVATVIAYYERFMQRFPTVEALAAGDLDEVLALWAGLGYYARARNLHAAARMVVREHGGQFPRTVEELRRLPGVGPYSAGAIASIAFGARAPLVDGNVARVIARLADLRLDITKGEGRRQVWSLAEQALPATRCGDFNQALMEFGATVCTPGASARCSECPLNSLCLARRRGRVADLPIKGRPARPREETHVVAAVCDAGRWLIRRRPARGLWGGLWELPSCVANGKAPSTLAMATARGSLNARIRVERKPFCDLTHALSHLTIRFVGHVCTPAARRRPRPSTSTHQKWLPLEQVRAAPLSAIMRRIVASLGEHVEAAPVKRSVRERTSRSGRRG